MSGEGAGRLKVLLVDDELGYLEVLQKRMSKRNLEVTPVSSGTEAVQQPAGRASTWRWWT